MAAQGGRAQGLKPGGEQVGPQIGSQRPIRRNDAPFGLVLTPPGQWGRHFLL